MGCINNLGLDRRGYTEAPDVFFYQAIAMWMLLKTGKWRYAWNTEPTGPDPIDHFQVHDEGFKLDAYHWAAEDEEEFNDMVRRGGPVRPKSEGSSRRRSSRRTYSPAGPSEQSVNSSPRGPRHESREPSPPTSQLATPLAEGPALKRARH